MLIILKIHTMTRPIPTLLVAYLAIMLFPFSSCVQNNQTKNVLGYAPVYADPASINQITFDPPHMIENGGKIYQYKNYTFQLETGKGIHIIQSSNPTSPQKIGFINILGCSEISIKNDILYTDNFRDLVGINIANLNQMQVASRIENVFPAINQQIPPHQGVYFECVDQSKGTVIGWTEKQLVNPKCKL